MNPAIAMGTSDLISDLASIEAFSEFLQKLKGEAVEIICIIE